MARFLTFQVENMNLQTQLLIVLFIKFVFIISFFVVLSIIHFKLLQYQFQQDSDQMFKLNSKNILFNIINSEQNYLNKVFKTNGNTLITLHRLYHATKHQINLANLEKDEKYQMDYAGTSQIPDPVKIINGYGDNDISYSFMCYTNLSNFENPKTIDELISIKMQEQIQTFGQILYSGKIINQYFFQTYIIKEKIYSIYPCLNRNQGIYGFKAEKRDWYIELQRNYELKLTYDSYNYSFTKPMLLFSLQKIGLSLAMPLVDRDFKLIGGVASIFLGTELVQRLEQNNYGFHVIYLITGFNFTDWLSIQSQTGDSSCPKFIYKQSSLKCRYNSLYQQEMIIGKYDMEQFKMILIMLVSSQEYLEFYRKYTNNLEADLQKLLNFSLFVSGGICIFLCFTIFKATDILCYPIRFLKIQALVMISKSKPKCSHFPKFISLNMSKEVKNLFESFKLVKHKLAVLSLRKTAYCQELERLIYPKNYLYYQPNINFFFIKFRKQASTLLENRKNVQRENKLREISRILKLSFHNKQN